MRRVPALFRWSLTREGRLKYCDFYALEGNILDVVVLNDRASVLVSIDHIHAAGSRDVVRSDAIHEATPRLQILSFGEDSQSLYETEQAKRGSVSEIISNSRTPEMPEGTLDWLNRLSELCYGMEHLRKRSTHD